MEGADSASTGMSNVPDRLSPQSGVSQEEKEDSNRSGSSSDESAKGSTNGGNNLSQGAKGSRGPDGSVSGTGQPARPSVKIFFTEGIATPSAGQASSAVGDSRSTADNRATERESSTNVGNSGEVERVDTRVTNTGGSNSNGVKGNLVHAQGQGQLVQGVGQRYSYPDDYRASLHSFRSPSSSNKLDRFRSSYRLNPLPPAVMYDSRPSIDSISTQDRWSASNRPLPVRQYGALQYATRDSNNEFRRQPESSRVSSNTERKPEFVVSSNLIEFPTASLYPRAGEQRDQRLVNSNLLRVQ